MRGLHLGVGMDEKSFRKGHKYISLINDLEEVRVLDVVEGHKGMAADEIIEKALEQVESLAKTELGMAKVWYIKKLFRNF